MMQTARATPAGAKSTAAQHTRAEMQQLRSQSHCKQHRSSPNGCSLNSTLMQLRLHHCYCCNIVQTALATIATSTMTTGANITPALCKCNRSCTHRVAPTLQPQLQLQLLQDCDRHHCKHDRNSSANAIADISNNVVNANAMPVQHETMACTADNANANANMSSDADAMSMQRNSKHQCKRRCNIHPSARAGAYARACKRQTSTKYTPKHTATSKLPSKPTAPTIGYVQTSNASNLIQPKQCTQPVCMHPTNIHVPNQYTWIRQTSSSTHS